MPAPFEHRTVLRDAVVARLVRVTGGIWLDGTLGGGGHTQALLEATSPLGVVFGIDRDPAAIEAATALLKPWGARFQAVRGTFAEMADLVGEHGPFNGIVLDLGVSSPQLDQAQRGFSFQQDGPVDCRMNPDEGATAAELIDSLTESELADVIYQYGEEPRSRRIARALKAGAPWTSTLAMAETVARASGYKGSRTHPATRTFQALRILTNDELGQLDRGLDAALAMLAPGGRLAIISFHSLEDRAVKKRFRLWAGSGTPRDAYGNPMVAPQGRIIDRKGVSGADADPENPRARSARLRVFEKSGQPDRPGLDATRQAHSTSRETDPSDLGSAPCAG
jgi:16S rRNA (cytosine1402-N4)-methyltransferase